MIYLRILTCAALAAGLLGGSAALAQTAPDAAAQASPAPAAPAAPHHHRNRMMAALRQLTLSEDQKARIRDIVKSFRSSQSSAAPETREAMRSQIEGVLTPDQRAQFESAMKRRPVSPASPA